MPKYLRQWILPIILFLIGVYISEGDKTMTRTGILVYRFFTGIVMALSGYFFQLVFHFFVIAIIKKKLGFLRGQKEFLSIILMLTAKLVKADGKVDNNEQDLITKRLSEAFNEEDAIRYLNEFQSYLKLDISIKDIGEIIDNDFDESTKSQLMYLLISLATADGLLSDSELEIIQEVAKHGRIKSSTYLYIFKTFAFKREQSDSSKQQKSNSRNRKTSKGNLWKACELIGVKKTATLDQIKKSYRKLAKIHHPDKVAYLGIIHQKKAKEKFQLIVEAYELIKTQRGFK